MDEIFVENVGDKENGRDNERPSHAVPVGDFTVCFDAKKTRKEKEGRDGVESCIEGRKV
jgi:hypothetical protein